MRRSKRSVLLPKDINNALQGRNQQPLFGFDFSDSMTFKQVPGIPGLYHTDNEEIKLDEVC
jgi:hypothetical protein